MSLATRVAALTTRIAQEFKNLTSPLYTSSSSIFVPYTGTTVNSFRMQRIGHLVTIQMNVTNTAGGSRGIGELTTAWRPLATSNVVASADGTQLHGVVYASGGALAIFGMPAATTIAVTATYLIA